MLKASTYAEQKHCTNPAVVTSSVGPILAAKSRLCAAITAQQEVINVILDRLTPVMTPQPPTKPDPEKG